MVKILLLKSFQSLGNIGEVISVKPGYAKHFLIPMKIAALANNKVLQMFENNKKELEKADQESRNIAEEIKSAILTSYRTEEGSDNNFTVIIAKKMFNDGKLYGSVSTKEIYESIMSTLANIPSLAKIDIKHFISPDKIKLMKNIKYEGIYDAKIGLYSNIELGLKVSIVRE